MADQEQIHLIRFDQSHGVSQGIRLLDSETGFAQQHRSKRHKATVISERNYVRRNHSSLPLEQVSVMKVCPVPNIERFLIFQHVRAGAHFGIPVENRLGAIVAAIAQFVCEN